MNLPAEVTEGFKNLGEGATTKNRLSISASVLFSVSEKSAGPLPLPLPAPLICGLSHNDFLNFDAELYAILNDMLDLDLGGNYYWNYCGKILVMFRPVCSMYSMITGLAHCIE